MEFGGIIIFLKLFLPCRFLLYLPEVSISKVVSRFDKKFYYLEVHEKKNKINAKFFEIHQTYVLCFYICVCFFVCLCVFMCVRVCVCICVYESVWNPLSLALSRK